MNYNYNYELTTYDVELQARRISEEHDYTKLEKENKVTIWHINIRVVSSKAIASDLKRQKVWQLPRASNKMELTTYDVEL